MLVDHRTYRVKPGTMAAHLDLYEQHGMVSQKRHLGEPLAYMVAESGELNTIVHIWAYEDAADRTRLEAYALLAEYRERLNEARAQAEAIIDRAREAGETHERDSQADAKATREQLMEQTRRDIEAETRRAIGEIRREVARAHGDLSECAGKLNTVGTIRETHA